MIGGIALVVKWISQRSSEPLLRVRIPPRAQCEQSESVLSGGFESRSATARGGVAGFSSRKRPVTGSPLDGKAHADVVGEALPLGIRSPVESSFLASQSGY